MGGRSSKPVRKIKVGPVDEDQIEGPSEDQQDEVQTAQDTLGIDAEESNYPEPAPPTRDLPTILEEEEDERKTISIDDDALNNSAIPTKLPNGETVPVKVGKSLQKSVSKASNETVHFGIHPNKDRFEYMYETDSSIGEPLVTSSMVSLRNSTMTEQQFNLISNALLQKSIKEALTQREMLLLERESYEYKRLTTTHDMTLNVTPRGQVRRYTSFKNDPVMEKNETAARKNKADITANEAAELHKDHRAETFKILIKDLTIGFKSDAIKVKTILAWMCKQEIGKIDFGEKRFSPDTPNGYIQLIQEGNGTFPGLFALLCRAADVKCVIITGVSKGAGYDVGAYSTDDLTNTWNAVYIDDGWRLVHPLWVCKSLAGRRSGGWMTIESQGSSRRDVNNSSSGLVHFSYNDYFIFTKPEEFLYRHFPEDSKWQLIPEPISLNTFLSRSYFRPAFFINEFQLLSKDKCVLESQEGEPVEIVVAFAESIGTDLVFGYEYSLKLDSSSEIIKSRENNKKDFIQQYVLVSKSKDRVTFEVRFSLIGVYKLRLFGGLYSEYGYNPPWIMEVKLVCNKILPRPEPLPFDPGLVGWGPSPIAENFGLFVPSHEESVIKLTSDDITVVHFILKQEINFDISLRHFRIRPGVLEDLLQYEILDVNDFLELRIKINCPNSGEYALKIDILFDSVAENACNYLLQTQSEKPRETFHQRKSRKILSEAMMSSDIVPLTAALKACEESALPLGDPEVLAGEKRLQFLQCKEELKFAFLVKRIDKIEAAIYKVQQANLECLFEKEIKRLKNHLKEILALDKDGWTSKIPEIDRVSLMELGQLRQPRQPVKYVIMSMYMLLGVSQEYMVDWNNIKQLLRNKDSTLVEMARLEHYLDMDSIEIISVDEHTLERVQEVLQTYSADDIRKIDNTAAAYYNWVKVTHRKLTQRVRARSSQRSRFSSAVSLKDQTASAPMPRSKSVAGLSRHQSFAARETQMKRNEVNQSKSFNTSNEGRNKGEHVSGTLKNGHEKTRNLLESAKDLKAHVSENTNLGSTWKIQNKSKQSDEAQSQREPSIPLSTKIAVSKPNSSRSVRPNVQARQLTMFSNRGYSGSPGSGFNLPSTGAGGRSRVEGVASDPLVNTNRGNMSRRGTDIVNGKQDKRDTTTKPIARGSSVGSVHSIEQPLSRNIKSGIKPFMQITRDNSLKIESGAASQIQTVRTTPRKETVHNSRPLSNMKNSDVSSSRLPSTNLLKHETHGIQKRKSTISLSPNQAGITTVVGRPEGQKGTRSPIHTNLNTTKTNVAEGRHSSPTKIDSKNARSAVSHLTTKMRGGSKIIGKKETDDSEKKSLPNGRVNTSMPNHMPSLVVDELKAGQEPVVKQVYKKDNSKDQTFIKT